MPMRPKTPCNKPGCPALTDGRYCEAHERDDREQTKERKRQSDKNRPTFRQRGYSHEWDKVSRMFKRNNPLCVHCLKDGRTTASREVDHIIPKVQGGTDEWDNLQALCKPCHSVKTATEDGGFGNAKLEIGG